MLIWVQAIQADEQQPYQVEVPSEPGRINELKLAILEAEQITLSTSHIYIRISRYGPKLFIGDKLVDIYPHGQSSDNPFWYLLLCPGNYGNRRVCTKGFFESTRTKYPAPILKRRELQNQVISDGTDSSSNVVSDLYGTINRKPGVTFYNNCR